MTPYLIFYINLFFSAFFRKAHLEENFLVLWLDLIDLLVYQFLSGSSSKIAAFSSKIAFFQLFSKQLIARKVPRSFNDLILFSGILFNQFVKNQGISTYFWLRLQRLLNNQVKIILFENNEQLIIPKMKDYIF